MDTRKLGGSGEDMLPALEAPADVDIIQNTANYVSESGFRTLVNVPHALF